MNTRIVPEPIARQPWIVILPLTALVCFGGAVLYSAAGGNFQPWALKHVLRFVLFLGMALVIARARRGWFQFAAFPIYGILVVLLVLVEIIGGISGGSQRWINLGFMTLQPSELMKPAIVLVLARFYDALPPAMTASWRALVPALGILGVPAALVMLQPDLGTALAITFGAIVVIFLAGTPLKWFIGGGLAAAVAGPIAFFTLLHDYQRKRVFVFLDPQSDPLGSGYHIAQSEIAEGKIIQLPFAPLVVLDPDAVIPDIVPA